MGYHGVPSSKPNFEHNIINFMTLTQDLHNLHIAPSPIFKVSWSVHLQIERSTKNFNYQNKTNEMNKKQGTREQTGHWKTLFWSSRSSMQTPQKLWRHGRWRNGWTTSRHFWQVVDDVSTNVVFDDEDDVSTYDVLIIDESFDDVLMEGLVLLIVFGLLGPVVGEDFVDIFVFEKKNRKKIVSSQLCSISVSWKCWNKRKHLLNK